MLASSTVENYLKAIYLGVGTPESSHKLLPMGQLAAALGVAPGTATTMVKTLAESGLVRYEPYAGVALTPAGEKLAALVVRRHRVIELFLVQVMGYGWDEVHDEAEQLEHVVSDRLIDQMDKMLGRPEVDPHGDPIPDATGAIKPQTSHTLLTCPLNTPVTITRVIDQDKAFLRFIESHHLKPGEAIEVEDRDAVSDSVRVRGKGDQRITIGARAASKLLVQMTAAMLLLFAFAQPARAQQADQPATEAPPFRILDNSFLVEEAFNQEAGIFQNIVGLYLQDGGNWEMGFTQEWPIASQTHQFSYTVATIGTTDHQGVGDVMLNYRWQATTEAAGRPAFSPRVSLIIPTGNADFGLGSGGTGWQVNLPFSKQVGNLYVHWNGGFTHTPSVTLAGSDYNLFTPHVAASGIWQLKPMFNLMLESVVKWEEGVDSGARTRQTEVVLSPGVRGGWDIGDTQVIVGVAVPSSFADGDTNVGVFGYFSYELPFTR